MVGEDVVSEGCVVVVRNNTYLKPCKIIKGRSYTFGKRNGKFTLNLDAALGHPFGTSFTLEKVFKKTFKLTKMENIVNLHDIVKEGGADNRYLQDDGRSQKLTPDEIMDLKDKGLTGNEVIRMITANSSTFKDKTVYAQQKYLNKKKLKYGVVITIHKPSIRLLHDMYYTQEPLKISNLRIDTLSQLLCHCNVGGGGGGGRFAVFESGMQGLVTAAMLHRMGTKGHLVQVYHGSHPQREAVDFMNFTQAQLEVLSFINVTKLCEISTTTPTTTTDTTTTTTEIKPEGPETQESEDLNPTKIIKHDQDSESEEKQEKQHQKPRKFVRKQYEDQSVSQSVLCEGVVGLVVACRQHPNDVFLRLLSFLQPGHPFVVFSPYKEPLMDLYCEVKAAGSATNLKVSETWLRQYQVLPQRTHPAINMSGGGGYLLYGAKVIR